MNHLIGSIISSTPDGCQIRLRVKPKAARDEIIGIQGLALKVAVREAPEKGKANRAVMKLLARLLDVASSSVSLRSGETSQDKTVQIAGLTSEECLRRLEPFLNC